MYASLQKAIREGKVKPGDRLTEDKLSKMFKISRAPIREAFPLLEKNRFIILGDRDGVVAVKREEAEEVLQKSLARNEKEKVIKRRLMQGESTLDIYGFGEILKARGLTEERA